jgi:hypothetical protein
VRVVRLWRQRTYSSSKVIRIVLITPGRAHSAPHRIRKLFERLRANERGIIVPPNIALRKYNRRGFSAAVKERRRTVYVYSFEGISVLCARVRGSEWVCADDGLERYLFAVV